MKIHPTALLQGLALACAMSILTTGPVNGQENARAPGTTLGNEIDDSVVTTRVKSALLADPGVKSFDIKVETRKGKVQLSGFVDTLARIDYAVALTRRVEGVKSVENSMSLKGGRATVGSTIDDGIVTARVKSALLADPGIKSFDIGVVTRKGEVQLSGYVDDRAQINRAIDVAQAVEGVQSVGNEMSVKK